MRRTAAVVFLFLVPLVASHAQPAPATTESTASAKAVAGTQSSERAVEFTYLKSRPGERDNLRRAIVANWFAMDAIAVKQGLMVDYKVFDSGSDEGEWNLKVMVIYPDARGYDGIREAFEKIRAAHKPVLIHGKPLRDFGQVVRTQRVLERVSESYQP